MWLSMPFSFDFFFAKITINQRQTSRYIAIEPKCMVWKMTKTISINSELWDYLACLNFIYTLNSLIVEII